MIMCGSDVDMNTAPFSATGWVVWDGVWRTHTCSAAGVVDAVPVNIPRAMRMRKAGGGFQIGREVRGEIFLTARVRCRPGR
jgi:hypothetical protein